MRGEEGSPKSSDVRLAVFALVVASCLTPLSWAATNEAGDDFKLRPPRGEIPASFWEQNRKWLVPMGIAGALAAGLLVWYFSRPKLAAEVPPEVRARKELDALTNQGGDREVLSRTSQVLKRYLAEVFGLPKEEMTTAEFCKVFNAGMEPGEALSKNVCDFLRRSDQMKFAPGPVPASTVPEARRLLEQTEARRAELKVAAAQQKGRSAAGVPEIAKS